VNEVTTWGDWDLRLLPGNDDSDLQPLIARRALREHRETRPLKFAQGHHSGALRIRLFIAQINSRSATKCISQIAHQQQLDESQINQVVQQY
jgi:hypothetical protein